MKRRLRQTLVLCLFCILTMLAASCQKSDYAEAIPANSKALMAVDAAKLSDQAPAAYLKSLLGTVGLGDCGIDFSAKVYLFETADGNVGLCAKISSKKDLNQVFERLDKIGVAEQMAQREHATTVKVAMSWAVAFNDNVLLAVGPVAPVAMGDTHRKMLRWMEQDGGITATPLFEKLESISAPVTLVAQAQALPDALAAPLTLGVPESIDPSQVLLAASFSLNDGSIDIQGETFSLDKVVNESLQTAKSIFRPISGTYASLADKAALSMFMDVDGKHLLELMQSSTTLQSLLLGANSAIDMYSLLRSVNGDLVLLADGQIPLASVSGSFSAATGSFSSATDPFSSANGLLCESIAMGAEVAGAPWLADVGYWKKSCPAGSTIQTVVEGEQYKYVSGGASMLFGITHDKKHLFCGTGEAALSALQSAPQHPAQSKLGQDVAGQRFVLMLNVDRMFGSHGLSAGLFDSVRDLMGSVKTIKYTLK